MYVVHLWAMSSRPLLGNRPRHRSGPHATFALATARLAALRLLNTVCGRPCAGRVVPLQPDDPEAPAPLAGLAAA